MSSKLSDSGGVGPTARASTHRGGHKTISRCAQLTHYPAGRRLDVAIEGNGSRAGRLGGAVEPVARAHAKPGSAVGRTSSTTPSVPTTSTVRPAGRSGPVTVQLLSPSLIRPRPLLIGSIKAN